MKKEIKKGSIVRLKNDAENKESANVSRAKLLFLKPYEVFEVTKGLGYKFVTLKGVPTHHIFLANRFKLII